MGTEDFSVIVIEVVVDFIDGLYLVMMYAIDITDIKKKNA